VYFCLRDIETRFLEENPSLWELRNDYIEGLHTVQQLQVANDNAERGVALIEEYNKIITKKETQKQYLLQVVQYHRRRFPECKKGSLVESPDDVVLTSDTNKALDCSNC